MTLVSAISWASGGVSYDILDERNNDAGVETVNAYLSHVAIVRGSLTEPQVTIVDYGAIVKGQGPGCATRVGRHHLCSQLALHHLETLRQFDLEHFLLHRGS